MPLAQEGHEAQLLNCSASLSKSHLRHLLSQHETVEAKSILYTAEAAAETPNKSN